MILQSDELPEIGRSGKHSGDLCSRIQSDLRTGPARSTYSISMAIPHLVQLRVGS